MAQKNVQTHSANRVLVKMDGTTVGAIQSMRSSDDYSPDAASGVGDIHAFEYVPTMARHTINVSSMVLIKANLRKLGLIPENGDAVLKGNVYDIIEQDKDTGEILRKFIGCSYASGDIDVQKHQIVTSNAVFNALDVSGLNA